MTKNKEEIKKDLLNRLDEKFKNENVDEINKIVNNQISDYIVVISEPEDITGKIFNGQHGSIQYLKRDHVQVLLRYSGSIGPVYKIDNSWGLELNLNHSKIILKTDDAVRYIKNRFYLTPGQTQRILEIFTYFIQENENSGNYINYSTSPIIIENGITHVNHNLLDNSLILKSLLEFYPKSSHPEYFEEVFSYNLLGPFHNTLKQMGTSIIQAPLLLAQGPSKSGKTSTPALFIGKGFDLPKDKFLYGLQRIKTPTDLNVHANESNIPMVIDDIKTLWLEKNKDSLKSYVQTGIFADRGKQNGIELNELRGQRSILFTLNDKYRIDTDQAASNRIFIETFTKLNVERENKEGFTKFKQSLPTGFMFSLIKEIFENKNIQELYDEVENIEDPLDWLNLGLKKINELCSKYKLSKFPLLQKRKEVEMDTNALEVVQAFIGEWDRISSMEYKSKIAGDFKVETKNHRIFIYFTAGAFKTLNSSLGLKLPYDSAIDFINNVKSDAKLIQVENEGKMTNVRMDGYPKHMYCISMSDSDDNFDNTNNENLTGPPKENIENGENGKNNNENQKENYKIDNIESLPDGPVKQSLIEEREEQKNNNDDSMLVRILKEFPTLEHLGVDYSLHENDILYIPASLANILNAQGACVFIGNGTPGKTKNKSETLKADPVKEPEPTPMAMEREEQEHNAKKRPVKKSIHYYQLNANFDKYGYDFFKGSDIELQSSRTFYYKDSTKIKYMLYQLLMPEEPENTPDGWFSFIKDGRELESEKAYNALSKGDLQ